MKYKGVFKNMCFFLNVIYTVIKPVRIFMNSIRISKNKVKIRKPQDSWDFFVFTLFLRLLLRILYYTNEWGSFNISKFCRSRILWRAQLLFIFYSLFSLNDIHNSIVIKVQQKNEEQSKKVFTTQNYFCRQFQILQSSNGHQHLSEGSMCSLHIGILFRNLCC